jgi:hypothetical protein
MLGVQQVSHIEGYVGFDPIEMADDTKPGATQIRFETRSEVMPALSEKENREVRKNFIWIIKTKDLGHTEISRRVSDSVEFDEKTGKWKILKLLSGQYNDGTPISDIRRYPDSWNLFMRGISDAVIGTPISILFKADPSRAALYKARGIQSIEQLAGFTDSDCQGMGMGAGDDRRKAIAYVAKIEKLAPGVAMNGELEARDKKISELTNTVADLTSKLTQILEAQLGEGDGKPAKKNKKTTETQENV